MATFQLIAWWYGQGWKQMVTSTGERLTGISHLFSVPILLRTLWAPWRRIITYPGATIDEKLRAFGDNMVSRAIGFTVRFLVLITAALMLAGAAVVSLVIIVVWPLIPLAVVGFCIIGCLR